MQQKQNANDAERNERIANSSQDLEIACKAGQKLTNKTKKRAAQRKAAKSKMGDENGKYNPKKKKSQKMRKRLQRLQNRDSAAGDSNSSNYNGRCTVKPEVPNTKLTANMETIALCKKHARDCRIWKTVYNHQVFQHPLYQEIADFESNYVIEEKAFRRQQNMANGFFVKDLHHD